MANTIIIDPISRISGFLEIRATVENNTITDAKAMGLLYRGFESMLRGKMPFDAIYYTERICGICSNAHAVSSTYAIENALNINVDENNRYIRDLIHGLEILQNHLRHFYLLVIPDFAKINSVKLASDQAYHDYRLPDDINQNMERNYLESIELSRLSHEGLATLGGKAPHNHGVFVGGVTINMDPYRLEKVNAIVDKLLAFVNTKMLADVNILGTYYPEYNHIGGSYPNYMSYGLFQAYDDPEITYVKPGVIIEGKSRPFNQEMITEQVQYSWYLSDNPNVVDMNKADAYSFIKSPNYEKLPMEVGPFARLKISGEYEGEASCLDRNKARVVEAGKVLNIMNNLIKKIKVTVNARTNYPIPQTATGVGLTDTSRGALGHWINIQNQVIEHYNIITPSVWNLSSRSNEGVPGVIEKALIGTTLNNIEEPIEVGRIVRSFDPCVSCATHLITNDGRDRIVEMPI